MFTAIFNIFFEPGLKWVNHSISDIQGLQYSFLQKKTRNIPRFKGVGIRPKSANFSTLLGWSNF